MPSEEERNQPKWSINELERTEDEGLRTKIKEMKRIVEKKLLQDFFVYVQTVPHDLRDDEIIDTFLDERNK